VVEIDWLYETPLWLDWLACLAVLLIAVELGFRLGLRRWRVEQADAKKTLRGDVTLGSMLALLGLLLAFTYAFSLGRADMRKQAIVQEANAIGTAFLRAGLAAEPGRSELRDGLLAYARTRLVSGDVYGASQQAVVQRSLEAQARLWPAMERALSPDTPGPLQALLVQSVNEVLDAHAIRIAAVNDRIPGAVLGLLLAVAAASLAVAAHNAALNGSSSRWRLGTFALILATLMLVIVDFDRGQTGLIRVSLQPLAATIEDLERQVGD
jgi:uncharacterized membrane protein